MDDSHRVTVFSRDVDGRTPLHIAARIGTHTHTHTHTHKYSVQAHTHSACVSGAGSTELVGLLLENGALVTATDHNGSTPLHLACQKGHQRAVVTTKKIHVYLQSESDMRYNSAGAK